MANLAKLRADLINAALNVINPIRRNKLIENCVFATTTTLVYGPLGSIQPFLKVEVGYLVTGTGIAAGTTVSAKSADHGKLTLSGNTTAASLININLDAAVTAGDVSITTAATGCFLAAGTVLNFVDTTLKSVTVKTDTAAGAIAVPIYPAPQAITDNTNAVVYNGDLTFWPKVGTGDAATKNFTVTLATGDSTYGVARKRVKVYNDVVGSQTETLTDNGVGVLVSDNVLNTYGGTINYATGAITAKFYAAPASGKQLVVTYAEGVFERRSLTNDNVDMTRKNEGILSFWQIENNQEHLLEFQIKPQNKTISNSNL